MANMRELDGSLLLQSRVLPDIVEIADLPAPPKPEELSRFLSFLGTLVLGSNLKYDGTVPQQTLDAFLSAAQSLDLTTVRPMEVSVEEAFVNDLRAAYSMASSHMQNALRDRPIAAGLKPLPESTVDAFAACISHMAGAGTRDERLAIAMEAYNAGLTGGKLLVGLAAQDENQDLAWMTTALSGPARAGIVSRMIDTFRPFLLSSWAGSQGSVYVAPPDAVNLIQTHQRALWTAVERTLVETASVKLPKYQQETLDAPMTGALVLMAAKPGDRPRDLISAAIHASRQDPALRQLSHLFWNLPIVGSGQQHDQVVAEITTGLMERVRSRGGPAREDLRPLLCRAATSICPAIGIPGASAAAAIACGENLVAQLATGAAGLTAAAVFCVVRTAQHSDPPAAAVSTALKRYDEVAPLLHRQVEQLWRPRGTT